MKIIVIIGDHPRNIGLLKRLYDNKKVEICYLILFKRDKLIPEPDKNLSESLKKLWKLHFEKRYLSERIGLWSLAKRNFTAKKFLRLSIL